jgi:tetratricopeptide (TPR) repeat protein
VGELETAQTTPDRRATLLGLLCALVGSFALYAHTLGGELVHDDVQLLVKSDCHRDPSRLARLFEVSRQTVCNQRPLRTLSFALDHALFGQSPAAYRAVNAVYHGLVVWLALLLLWRLSGDRFAAICGAALFAVHPIATEAVAHVSGRGELLFALLALAVALTVLPGAADAGKKLSWARLLLAPPLLLGAFLASGGAVVLPFALALLALARRWPRGEGWAHQLRCALSALRTERRLALLVALMLLASLLAAWAALSGDLATRPQLWGQGVDGHVATMLRVHAHYLRQLALPTALQADYSPAAFRLSAGLLEASALGALVLVGGAIGLALWAFRRAPLAAASVLCYFGLLVPSSQLWVRQELAAERWLYLPALALVALLAGAASALARRSGRLRLVALAWALLLPLLALVTVQRAIVWTSAELLWSTTVAQAPGCARARAELGAIYARQGQLDGAQRQLEAALAVRPELCAARRDLGQVLLDRGKLGAGLKALRAALVCEPSTAGYRRLSRVELRFGQARAAEASARAALRRKPRDAELLYLLGRAEQLQGRLAVALRSYRAALTIDPRRWRALLQIGRISAVRCRLVRAERIASVLARLPKVRQGRVAALRRLISRSRRSCAARKP